jgi:ubiquinone/menaquinone biosynthesis C-methylase UbiE
VTSFDSVSLERVQAYWDARPCNIRHSEKPVGCRSYFDEVEQRKYFVEPHIPAFAAFHHWKGKRVLELGCGIGTDAINFARHDAIVTAVDLSQRSVDLARQRAEVLGLSDRITFYHADGERLSAIVPVEPYDLVYSFGVIHHSPHPECIFSELRRFLAPAGTLKVMLYHRRSWKVLWILLTHGRCRFWDLERIVARHSEAQTGCPVTYTYSRRAARQLVEAAGFRVSDLQTEHIFPYRITDYVEYRYVREWYFRWMPYDWFRACERLFGWHLLITAEAA